MAKNSGITRLVLVLLCGMVLSFRPASLEAVVTSQIGQVEKPLGSNWGQPVQTYLAHTHVGVPAAWCAAFVRYCLDSAGILSSINAYAPSAHNKNNIVYLRGKWYKPMEPDDVFTVYFPAMGRIAHTGFAHRKINSAICETVEGNSNNNGSREGVGVFKRKRSFHSLYSISRWR